MEGRALSRPHIWDDTEVFPPKIIQDVDVHQTSLDGAVLATYGPPRS